jgi:hypothetical protein
MSATMPANKLFAVWQFEEEAVILVAVCANEKKARNKEHLIEAEGHTARVWQYEAVVQPLRPIA